MNLNEQTNSLLAQLEAHTLKRALPACPPDSRQLDFSSNDYLGLSRHPEVVCAGVLSAEQYGAGATGSRLLSGNLDCFEALESQIATFKRSEAALLYSSGYQANSTALGALLDKALWNGTPPVVFSDRLNHASLHHACQLQGIKQIRFRHNDMAHLQECLARYATDPSPKIIVTETVFGMEGDLLPIETLAEIAEQNGCVVYLDEAHATGLWGPQGRGLGASQSPAIDALKATGHWVVMGTFSKAVGVSGAYISCSTPLKHYLINRSTGFVYSTAPSPFVVGAVSKALELIPGMDAQRNHVSVLSDQLRALLQARGLSTGSSNTHIVPVMLHDADYTMRLKQHLWQQGLRTSAIRPPTVPPNTSRLRLALNANHTQGDLQVLLCALGQAIECIQTPRTAVANTSTNSSI